MRINVFVVSFAVTMIACTWGWEQFVKDRIYNCTDDFPLGFLQPGQWAHHPVAVPHVTSGRSMSEPDTIKQGWSVLALWLLWFSFIAGSLIVSFVLARLLRRGPGRQPEQIYEHTNAA